MRRLIASALTTMLLTGCGLAERFSSPEERINAAVPPGSGVQAAHQRLTLQVADQPEEKKALEAAWSTRLRLRALSCSRDFAPSWRDSAAGGGFTGGAGGVGTGARRTGLGLTTAGGERRPGGSLTTNPTLSVMGSRP